MNRDNVVVLKKSRCLLRLSGRGVLGGLVFASWLIVTPDQLQEPTLPGNGPTPSPMSRLHQPAEYRVATTRMTAAGRPTILPQPLRHHRRESSREGGGIG